MISNFIDSKPDLSHFRQMVAVFVGTFLFFLLFINVTFPSNSLIVATFFPLFFLLMGRWGFTEHKTILLPIIIGIYLMFLWVGSLLLNASALNQAFFPESKKLILAFCYHFALLFLYSKNESILFKTINYTIWILVGFWYIQFVIYYSTGYYLDPLNLLGIREQKYAAYFARGAYLEHDLIRPTSFYNEPGTYGSNIFLLLVTHYLFENKLKIIHVATLISMICSLSTFSIIAAVAFLALFIIDKLLSSIAIKRFAWLLFGLILSLCTIPLVVQYVKMRTIKGIGFVGANMREYLVDTWMSFPLDRLVMGSGLFSCDLDLSKYTGFKTIFHGNSFYFLQDSSFGFYLLVTLGIWSLPLIIIFRYYFKNVMFFLFFSIILLLKTSLTNYTVWTTLACLVIISNANTVIKSKIMSCINLYR